MLHKEQFWKLLLVVMLLNLMLHWKDAKKCAKDAWNENRQTSNIIYK